MNDDDHDNRWLSVIISDYQWISVIHNWINMNDDDYDLIDIDICEGWWKLPPIILQLAFIQDTGDQRIINDIILI